MLVSPKMRKARTSHKQRRSHDSDPALFSEISVALDCCQYTVMAVSSFHMGGCQIYGPFLDPFIIRHLIFRVPKKEP